MRPSRLLPTALALALPLGAAPAFADTIDGNWCSAGGRRIVISGPAIVTPGGTHMTGNYSRHFFSYEAPASDPEQGQRVAMTLLNENTVAIVWDSAAPRQSAQADEIWHRCPPAVSLGPEPLPAG